MPRQLSTTRLQAQQRLREVPVAKPDLEAELLADIAAAHYLGGNNAAAEKYYAEALDKMTQMGRGESPSVFFLRNNWGLASFSSGDIRRALEQYDEALRIAVQKSVEGKPPPYLLLNRASALSTLARYPEALKAYDVALEAATEAGNATRKAGRTCESSQYLCTDGRCQPRRIGARSHHTRGGQDDSGGQRRPP